MPRIWHRVYVIGSLLWAGALPAATLAVTERSGAAHPLALVVYGVGAMVCHQRPERSFHLASTQFPVCARCLGIYLGAAVTVVGVARRHPRLPTARRVRAWVVAAALPAGGTLLYEWIVGSTPSNMVRAASGVPLGVVVTWVMLAATNHDGAPLPDGGRPARSG